MIEKLQTLFWFSSRPSHWRHAIALAQRKFLPDYDTPDLRGAAKAWAADRATPVADALAKIGIDGQTVGMDPALIAEGKANAAKATVKMGGPGDLDLLSNAVCLTKARLVIETGVAYGWSSLAILNAMAANGGGQLVSVDMPYPKMDNEAFVGIVVPDRLRGNWTLVREPDRNGLKKALRQARGSFDLVHYDSDKSFYGRRFAFPLLWAALRPGGIFISDDIQDNLGFAEFVEEVKVTPAVTESGGKFVGICRKP